MNDVRPLPASDETVNLQKTTSPIKETKVLEASGPDALVSGSDRVYLAFYGFKETPFSITPDPEFLFLSNTHRNVIDKIQYGINSRMGFLLLTGEVGTGKTTICRAILDELSHIAETVYIINPSLSGQELITSILDDLGVTYPAGSTKKELIDHLNEFLLSVSGHRPTVIMIDDAQTIGLEALEDLRLLSNLETDKQKLLQIVLVAQPELLDMISNPELRQLKQRVAITCHLEYLSKDEIEGYILRRLFIAGDKGHIRFTRKAIRLIYNASKGIPRLINKVCDFALTSGYISNHFTINHRDVKKAIAELGDLDTKTQQRNFFLFQWTDFKNRKIVAGFLSVFLMMLMFFFLRFLYHEIGWGDLKKPPSRSGKQADSERFKDRYSSTESTPLETEPVRDTRSIHAAVSDAFAPKPGAGIQQPPMRDKREHAGDLSPDQAISRKNAAALFRQPDDDTNVSSTDPKKETSRALTSQSRSFILQLGSYNTLETAMRGVGFYAEKGIRVHWNRVDLGKKGQWFRVFTGVFQTKDDLTQYRKDLNLKESRIVWTPWTVLTGQSGVCDDLEPIQSVLKKNQFDFFLKEEPFRCQVLSGAFVTREGAEKLVEELLAIGIAAEVVPR